MFNVILSLFKMRNIFLYAGIAIAALSAFWYVANMQARISELQFQRDEVVAINERQAQRVDELIQAQEETSERLRVLSDRVQKAERENKELRDKFIEHDLKELAKKKPGLIEKRINNGTSEVIDELNEITNS